MRLLRINGRGQLSFTKDFAIEESVLPYAILSHTWHDDEEITYRDMIDNSNMHKAGYDKIRFCAQQAQRDGLSFFWVDTCCINKDDEVELREAISSMFRWYQNAAKCYVFLADVSASKRRVESDLEPRWTSAFRASRWFQRGWTLQELLAPDTVEFFSKEQKKIGDKKSLQQYICEATRIPTRALVDGALLSEFSINERLAWSEHRQTKVPEDKAYCLIGILGVHMSPFYGEGAGRALERLMGEVDKTSKCLQDLHLTDPRDDKKRIEETKGGLLEDSYVWALDTPSFQQWRIYEQSRLLWIKGDPGKGKTMILCGVIDQINVRRPDLVAFFFCQGTNSVLNSATAVLRGLIYLLVVQQPMLASHLRKRYDQVGGALFEDTNAWVALSSIFENIVQDASLGRIYLIVDALDECTTDLSKLLNLIVRTSKNRVKWLISSRNEAHIELKLATIHDEAKLSLELKQNAEHVSHAVDLYIDFKLSGISTLKDDQLKDQVRKILRQKANGTFLWVALVVQELERPETWNPLQVVEEVPSGLDLLYNHMIGQVQQLRKSDSELCRALLSATAVAFRPLYLVEIGSLCGSSSSALRITKNIKVIVAMCGSFLTIQNDQIYLIHQSAKDYLVRVQGTILPLDWETHYHLFSRSIDLMGDTLKRDMYGLTAPGFRIEKIKVPDPDPLAAVRYSLVHWVQHLFYSLLKGNDKDHGCLEDDGTVHKFMKSQFLYWLEALSLCRSMLAAGDSMTKLKDLLQGEKFNTTAIRDIVPDGYRFVMYHQRIIQSRPLQVYSSALLFSPRASLVRAYFEREKPPWGAIQPYVRGEWNACLQILEGHKHPLRSIFLSHGATRLASLSNDGEVMLWNLLTGECEQTLKTTNIFSVAFSRYTNHLALLSENQSIKIWNIANGNCEQTIEDYGDLIAVSDNATHLACVSGTTIKVWNVGNGQCEQKLEGHSFYIHAVVFLRDSALLVSASTDSTIKIWNTSSGDCEQTLEGHSLNREYPIATSYDSSLLASTIDDLSIRIWDVVRGKCKIILEGNKQTINSMLFSEDSTMLVASSAPPEQTVRLWMINTGQCRASISCDLEPQSVILSKDSRLLAFAQGKLIEMWDGDRGECVYKLRDHTSIVSSLAFSYDSNILASASHDETIKIWDLSSKFEETAKEYGSRVTSLVLSHDGALIAATWASRYRPIKIFSVKNGECQHEIESHSQQVVSVAFIQDSTQLISVSQEGLCSIWDINSGHCIGTYSSIDADTIGSITYGTQEFHLAPALKLLGATSKIWNVSTETDMHTDNSVFNRTSVLGMAAFSPDSKWLALGMDDGSIQVWETSKNKCAYTLFGHRSQATALAFSQDSSYLASGSWDLTVKIWGTSDRICMRTIKVVGRHAKAITFSHDSARIAISMHWGYRAWNLYVYDWLLDKPMLPMALHLSSGEVSFNEPGTHLRTDIGTVDIATGKFQGLHVRSDNTWIMYDQRHLLWIPSEYRPNCLNISQNTVALGTEMGQVYFFKFDPANLSD